MQPLSIEPLTSLDICIVIFYWHSLSRGSRRDHLTKGAISFSWVTIWTWNNNSWTFFAHLTSSRRKRKLNTHQNNHLYRKIGFFFLDFNTDFYHCWKVELHKLFIFYTCKTDYCFIKSVTWNDLSGSLTHFYQLGALLLRKRVKCHSPIQ